jgi:Uma2 family endonuclease
MGTAERTRRYTPDDLLAMPDGDRYETARGELVEKPVSEDSDGISGEIFFHLKSFVRTRGLGWAFGGDRLFRCFPHDPSQGRKPDASFVSSAKLPDGPTGRGITPVPPDLAVEVVSPDDVAYELEEKLADYRLAGVPLIWVVYPNRRTVHVFSGGSDAPTVLHESDTLTGGDVLPGFSVKVADLFPSQPS